MLQRGLSRRQGFLWVMYEELTGSRKVHLLRKLWYVYNHDEVSVQSYSLFSSSNSRPSSAEGILLAVTPLIFKLFLCTLPCPFVVRHHL